MAKFCTQVFVMPKDLMTKLNTLESSLYMSPLRAIVLFQQYCIITVIWSIIVLFAPLLNMRRCIVCYRKSKVIAFVVNAGVNIITNNFDIFFLNPRKMFLCRKYLLIQLKFSWIYTHQKK